MQRVQDVYGRFRLISANTLGLMMSPLVGRLLLHAQLFGGLDVPEHADDGQSGGNYGHARRYLFVKRLPRMLRMFLEFFVDGHYRPVWSSFEGNMEGAATSVTAYHRKRAISYSDDSRSRSSSECGPAPTPLPCSSTMGPKP